MAKIFDDILLQGIRSGKAPARNSTARVWFRDKAQSVGKVNETQLIRGASAERKSNPTTFEVGNMYCFLYDPKHKKTLPYYDKFPLIFPIGNAKGGFLGINFHYLPYPLRAKLMDALYDTVTNEDYDTTTKMKISYGILNGAAKFNVFKPTIKHYLVQHVRSPLIYIHPSEWDIALFLDTARFVGASQTEVWKDSKAIIRG